MEKATFAAGWFWGVEEALRKVKGVMNTEVGYIGGHFKNPTYKDVCTGETGHAEAVMLEYDPSLVTYDELLNIFFKLHDPTTPGRQGLDIGSQYRSIIFYHNEMQKHASENFIKNLESSGVYKYPIITEITEARDFYKAEEYHQKYIKKREESYNKGPKT